MDHDYRECENRLLVLLGFDLFDTIKLILHNRVRIWASVSLKRARSPEERQQIETILKLYDHQIGQGVWDELHAKGKAEDWTRDRIKGAAARLETTTTPPTLVSSSNPDDTTTPMTLNDQEPSFSVVPELTPPTELDLDALAFRDGAHTMTNKKCHLPDTSWRAMKKGYEEVHVPAVQSVIPKDETLVAIRDLPTWTQAAFQGMDHLNRIQSKLCDVALRTSEPILLCAPTGAGKTNVAILTILNLLGQYRRDATIHQKKERGDGKKEDEGDDDEGDDDEGNDDDDEDDKKEEKEEDDEDEDECKRAKTS